MMCWFYLHCLCCRARRQLLHFIISIKMVEDGTASKTASKNMMSSKSNKVAKPPRPTPTIPPALTNGAVDGPSFLRSNGLKSPLELMVDFEGIKPVPATPDMCLAENDQENLTKNRYCDIPCLDMSRVRLDEEYNGDYLHANYVHSYSVEKCFIMCQAPLPNTIFDFWRMVWKEDVKVIVCMTRMKEDECIKCAAYWPQILSEMHRHGPIYVMQQARNECINFDHTELWLGWDKESKGDVKPRNVHMLHVHGWPDNTVPTESGLIPHIRKKMHELNRNLFGVEDSPIVVHCGGGVGRSAVLVAFDILAQQLEITGKLNMHETIMWMRCQRSMAIRKREHYLSLYLSLVSFMTHDIAPP